MIKTGILVLLLSITFSYSGSAQENMRNIFPVWTYHHRHTNIHGVSLGFFSTPADTTPVRTNGIKLELIGTGILLGLAPRMVTAESDEEFVSLTDYPVSEKVNGIALSPLGVTSDCRVNGLTIGGFGQYNRAVNGVGLSLFLNESQTFNGFQLAIFNSTYHLNGFQLGVSNSTDKMRGIQIGILNFSKDTKGIQIGIWNKNEKRGFPIINWNFKGE